MDNNLSLLCQEEVETKRSSLFHQQILKGNLAEDVEHITISGVQRQSDGHSEFHRPGINLVGTALITLITRLDWNAVFYHIMYDRKEITGCLASLRFQLHRYSWSHSRENFMESKAFLKILLILLFASIGFSALEFLLNFTLSFCKLSCFLVLFLVVSL